MRQLIETDQRDLSALPVVDCAVVLQVRKLDLADVPPAPFARSDEDHRKIRSPADIAQRLEKQSDGFPSTRRAAVGQLYVSAQVGRYPMLA